MKMYFEFEDGEECYSEDYFQELMEANEDTEMEVFPAIKQRVAGIYWCKVHKFCGDKGDIEYSCGKECKEYDPRNGISGCCRYYETLLYYAGEKITLKKSNGKR